jgi:hypothetical protein
MLNAARELPKQGHPQVDVQQGWVVTVVMANLLGSAK